MEREERGVRWIFWALLVGGVLDVVLGVAGSWFETHGTDLRRTMGLVQLGQLVWAAKILGCMAGLAQLRRDSAWLGIACLGVALFTSAILRPDLFSGPPPYALLWSRGVAEIIGCCAAALAVARTARAAGQPLPRWSPLAFLAFLVGGAMKMPFGMLADLGVLSPFTAWVLANLVELGLDLLVVGLIQRSLRQPWPPQVTAPLAEPLPGEGWARALGGLALLRRATQAQVIVALAGHVGLAMVHGVGQVSSLRASLPSLFAAAEIAVLLLFVAALRALRHLPDPRVRGLLPVAGATALVLVAGHAAAWRGGGLAALVDLGDHGFLLLVLVVLRRLALVLGRPLLIGLATRAGLFGVSAVLLTGLLRWILPAYLEPSTMIVAAMLFVALILFYAAYLGLLRDLLAALRARLTTTDVFD